MIDHTLKYKERKYSETVYIKCLEHVAILISHNAVLDAIEKLSFCVEISHIKALIKAGNVTSNIWTRKIACSSVIGKMLNRIFCATLIN